MGQLLSNLENGSLVKLAENTKPTKFIKLGNDHYGSGTGTTLIRKDCFAPAAWSAASINYQNHFMGCTLDNICDNIWPSKLDSSILDYLVPVPIVVAEGGGVSTLHTIYRKAFPLSCAEIGLTGWQAEGKAFAYFSDNSKRICYVDETAFAAYWGLRSPFSNAVASYRVNPSGELSYGGIILPYFAARPAFNLKSSILVSDSTDSDGCYIVENVTKPRPEGGLYVKKDGVWINAL